MNEVEWNINYSNTHIIPCKYDYYEPKSLNEAIEILSKYGPSAKILAGGTDLLILIKMGVLKPKCIVNIKKISDLNGIREHKDQLIIGALTKLRTLEKSKIIKENFTALYEAVKSMASIQIRNMATVGGNLCNASPAADTAPPLMVFNAFLRIAGPDREKIIPITSFFKGPKRTILNHNEILTEIILSYPSSRTGSAFIKIARTAMDLAKANVAVKLVIREDNVVEDVAVALGSVAPTPVRAFSVEKYLHGKIFSEEIALEASKLVVKDISPITDARSTAEYRRYISKVITYEALVKAFRRAKRR